MRRGGLENLWYGAAAGAISLAFALVSIKFWNANLDIPFEYYWDSLFFEAQIKGVLENATPFHNPDLGFPYGQDFVDFYQGGLTTYGAAWVLGLFTNSWPTVVNLIWLGGFPLVAVTTWWAMSSLGIARLPALVAAVAFAILPYHFWRGQAHLILSGYFTVALGGFLVLEVLRGQILFPARLRAGESRQDRLGTATTIVACLLIALSAAYYSVFAILLLGAASTLALLVRSRRKAGLSGLVATLLIGLFLVISLAPSLAFRMNNGTNPEAGVREARESEYYGLSLGQMLLPATNHRLDPLAEVKQRFLSQTITPSEDAQSLGLLGVVGLAFCLVGLLVLPMGRPKWAEQLVTESGLAALLGFLLGSIGGAAILVAFFVSPQIRAWNRLSVFIAFFALVGLAVLLGRLFSAIEERTGKRAPGFLLAGLLLVFALWDQTPARWPEQFKHDLIEEEYQGDQSLVSRMEAALPRGAAVFQIPYLEYPEAGPQPGRVDDFDPLRGYLHSTDLKWSYGAIKGRSADIQSCVRNLSIPSLTRVIRAWGFSALWIDSFGYPEREARRVVAKAGRATDSVPIQDRSGRFKVFLLDSGESPSRAFVRRLRGGLPTDGSAVQDCGPLRKALAEAGL